MSKKYSRAEIIDACDKAIKDVETFYRTGVVNYLGRTYDTGEYYTEIVAEYVLNHIDAFDKIRMITREATYDTAHNGICHSCTNRDEERTAIELYNQCQAGTDYAFIGKILNYQVPLKNKQHDCAGKIDLLSVNKDTLYILELKSLKSHTQDSMLRCVLEAYTYFKTVDHEKLISDYAPKCSEIVTNIKIAPLVFKAGCQYREMQDNRLFLFELMSKLDCTPYYLEQDYKSGIYAVDKE